MQEQNHTYQGHALTYGDDINTDIISPPQYMELSVEEAAKYAMSGIDPDFSKKVNQSTILVVGKNFGSGSSRETSPLSLKLLGVRVIVAKFFARIFYRNAINVGILVLECPDTDRVSDNDELVIDVSNGVIHNVTKNEDYQCSKIPEHIMALIQAGGLKEKLRGELLK